YRQRKIELGELERRGQITHPRGRSGYRLRGLSKDHTGFLFTGASTKEQDFPSRCVSRAASICLITSSQSPAKMNLPNPADLATINVSAIFSRTARSAASCLFRS